MYELTVENKYGDIITLSNNPAYVISNIDGIDPPTAVINTTRNANADGSIYNSAYADNRKIIITLAINSPAEENRIALYRYFKSKSAVRLYYKTDSRDLYIDAYVENIDVQLFNKKQIAQITLLCPNPYFTGVNTEVTDFQSVQDLFEFPFASAEEGIEFSKLVLNAETNVYNGGDVETGAMITIRAAGVVTTPRIYDVEANTYFILDGLQMAAGDVVTINTVKKQKSVKLIHEGVETNIINYVKFGSTWFQIQPFDNTFIVNAVTNPQNMYVTFEIADQFEGV